MLYWMKMIISSMNINTHRKTVLMRILLKWIIVFIFMGKIFLPMDSKEIAALHQWLLVSPVPLQLYLRMLILMQTTAPFSSMELSINIAISRITVRPHISPLQIFSKNGVMQSPKKLSRTALHPGPLAVSLFGVDRQQHVRLSLLQQRTSST